ncbi:MAG: hypothetical protein ABN490_07360, partial [Pantoea agglomerans]
ATPAVNRAKIYAWWWVFLKAYPHDSHLLNTRFICYEAERLSAGGKLPAEINARGTDDGRTDKGR